MKRFLFLVTGLFSLLVAEANTYYFSSTSGSDDRSAKQAQNPSTPWKSLDKLNSFFSDLEPGDAVLLKRNDVFFGSITINKSGSNGSPIVIGAYGTGAKPVITSLVTIKVWSADRDHNGVYQSGANTALSSTVNTVLINGAAQELGRYPNSDADNKGYLTFESHEGTSSITDNDLSSNIDWTGAQLVLRSRRWTLDRDLITSQSGNTISYNPSSKYQPVNKYGYFIQNDIRTLDKSGEWYFNPSSKQLSVFLGRKNPASYTIQASAIDNLISSTNNSNIVFDNLQIKGSNVCGFLIKFGSNINIKNCDILFSGRDGVKVVNSKNFDIENCTVANSNNNGIDFGFSGSDNATIRNNIIKNTSVFNGMGGSGDGKGIAIQSYGNGSTIEYNEIRNTGYTAIYFNGNNVTIKNNFIDGFCFTKDDGAGIYTYTGSNNNTNTKHNRSVIGNIVMNGIGATQGSNDPKPEAEGIYMDSNAANVEINNNTVANCGDQGIFLHGAHDITLINNTIFNNNKRQFAIVEPANSPVRNLVVTNNIFYSTLPSQGISNLQSNTDGVNIFGQFDKNYYIRSQDEKTQNLIDKIKVHEANAKFGNLNNAVRFEYNPTKENKTIVLDGNYTDVQNNNYSNNIILKPYSSVILLKRSGKKFS